MSSQWLSLLSVLSSKDPRSPQGPQAPQIHRSTESTEPGSSPDLLDLSYAAMQILTVLIYCFAQAAPDSTRSRTVESVCSQSHLSRTLTLVRFRFDLFHTLTLVWK